MTTKRSPNSFLTVSLASLMALGLSACDQHEERQERATSLFEATKAQIANPIVEVASPLERATPAERALFGTLSDSAQARIASEQKRIAVGSIVLKPKSVEQMQAVVREKARSIAPGVPTEPAPQDKNTASGGGAPAPVFRSLPRSAPDPGSAEPVISSPELRGVTEANLEPRIMEAMVTAQSSVFEEMNKLGLDGSVATSAASGQMVVDMFASESQLSSDEDPNAETSSIVEDIEVVCPERATKTQMQNDKLLATNCMIDLLRASGQFEYVEKDFIFEHQFARRPPPADDAKVTPNDTLWQLQWHFRSNGTEEDQSAGGAGFVDFWTDQGLTDASNITVAVVDTGLALSHPDIAGSANVLPGFDMVSDPAIGNDGSGRDSDPNDPGDGCTPTSVDSYHGTHVAGTIGAASNNGAGVSGGAWAVKIVPVRALGRCGGKLSDINDAIRWAGGIMPEENENGDVVFNENPAKIINLSIGLFDRCPDSMQDAIDAVVERGAIVVAAAGNARLATEFYAPASCNNVITVAAGDARGHLTPYSNFGPEVDILAPGGDLDRDDNGDGHPDGVLSTRLADGCIDPLTQETVASCYYAFEQGTSMAAPHVSAALALLSARDPSLTGAQLTSRLLASLDSRDADQCTTSCDLYPDATPIPGRPGICMRACGGQLNLGNFDATVPASQP